ncbi:hypothetical protein F4820DRAFT_245869 [Hypoxylon rubiginosum]|uniref:Uncharacterized protein n=1 Tax=Hypoxylon rubiginosum TaxID=110542 RepID=A0ACB9Z4V5_9PEZI|nr:hypothetical protein F4820DRAFT_245869 [Hypoxylon rubiginosum]
MSVPASAPKTIEQLQNTLRLKTKADAEALVRTGPVADAFLMYLNRCLSSSAIKQQLPDWKDIDEYLTEKRLLRQKRIVGKTIEEVVTKESVDKPYDLVSHAALFALRIMTFLKSDKGEKYDASLEEHRIKHDADLSFDRCKRIMALLGFLVHQSREATKKLNAKRDKEMKKAGFV